MARPSFNISPSPRKEGIHFPSGACLCKNPNTPKNMLSTILFYFVLALTIGAFGFAQWLQSAPYFKRLEAALETPQLK